MFQKKQDWVVAYQEGGESEYTQEGSLTGERDPVHKQRPLQVARYAGRLTNQGKLLVKTLFGGGCHHSTWILLSRWALPLQVGANTPDDNLALST